VSEAIGEGTGGSSLEKSNGNSAKRVVKSVPFSPHQHTRPSTRGCARKFYEQAVVGGVADDGTNE
jgi:hypothetical protein